MAVEIRKFTGRDMVVVMIIFFAVILMANLTLLYFAQKTWSGLVVENPFTASQNFNSQALERSREIAMGKKVKFHYKKGEFKITGINSTGERLAIQQVEVKLGRPTVESEDRSFILQPNKEGEIKTALELPRGLWSGMMLVTLQEGTILHQPIYFEVQE